MMAGKVPNYTAHNPQSRTGLPVEIPDCCLFPFALKFWFRQRSYGFLKGQGGEVNAYLTKSKSRVNFQGVKPHPTAMRARFDE